MSSPKSSSRKKRKPRGKLFYLLINEREESGAVSLKSLRRSDLIKHEKVPGYIKQEHEATEPRVGELTAKGRHVIASAKDLVCLMHRKKLTLNGNFSGKNLVWVSSVKQVKFRRLCEEDFSPFTPEAGEEDFKAIAEAVEDMLKECHLPWDLKDWLSLLKTFPMDNPFLVKNHVALKSHREKIGYYIYLYGLLEQLQELMRQGDEASRLKYNAVLNAIHAGRTTENKDWKADVFYNIYLKDVFLYKRKEYLQCAGASALLAFGRHCTQHLMQRSVKNGKTLFKYGDMFWMIETVVPGLFQQFQIAMVEQGLEGFAD